MTFSRIQQYISPLFEFLPFKLAASIKSNIHLYQKPYQSVIQHYFIVNAFLPILTGSGYIPIFALFIIVTHINALKLYNAKHLVFGMQDVSCR